MKSQVISAHHRALLLACVASALLSGLNGCGTDPSGKPTSEIQSTSSAQSDEMATKGKNSLGGAEKLTSEDHGHKPGAHGGLLVSIGADNYHAEAVFQKGGTLKLFILGKDESRIQEVEEQRLTAFARPVGNSEALEFFLDPKPQSGDTPGKTSVFEGKLPEGMAGKALEVTVQAIRVAGERFRLSFSSAEEKHPESSGGMPASLDPDAEKKLFLSPGGAYTREDITANGNRVASEKFKGIRANHDAKPKAGDRICPVSLTKANPAFTWTIGGKQYQFCCPPCVEEFVQMAKDKPADLKGPETYVAK